MGEQGVRVVQGDQVPAIRVKWRPTDADHLRDYFMSKPFDQELAAFYPNDQMEAHGLLTPRAMLHFTRSRIEETGYRGWYVLVVHDKKGSTVWHVHMMLDGRNNQFNKVRRALRRRADVNYEGAGPIRDLRKCAGYQAMRACETGWDSDKWEFAFMGEHKKFRPRGSRGRRTSRGSLG